MSREPRRERFERDHAPGRPIATRRLRARSTGGQEFALPSFTFAADPDPLDRHTMEAIACGVSTRQYPRHREKLPESLEERPAAVLAAQKRFRRIRGYDYLPLFSA